MEELAGIVQQFGIGAGALAICYLLGKEIVKHFVKTIETKDEQLMVLGEKFNATTERHIDAVSKLTGSIDRNTEMVIKQMNDNHGLKRA